jgi:sulfate transport system permease protein
MTVVGRSASPTISSPVPISTTWAHAARLTTRGIALGYLLLLLALPVGLVFYRTFEHGLDPVLRAIAAPDFQHAFWLTVTITAIAVPVNTTFGIVAALALVRRRFPGRGLLNAVIDLPFALSPVVIGLSMVLVYGKNGWFGGWLTANGLQVIFALPGMVLATVFVSLPFVVREVMPVLREIGTDQEEAAYTLGASAWRTFWRVTLPAIRWGVIYGVILTTARSLGEFGAVSIVSGRLSGRTETMTLYVQERFEEFDLVGAYTASVVLALLAIGVLLAMNILQSDRGRRLRAQASGLRSGLRDRPPA